MCRIDRIVQNLIIFPDFILYILSIHVNRISDDPLIISIFQKEICHAPRPSCLYRPALLF